MDKDSYILQGEYGNIKCAMLVAAQVHVIVVTFPRGQDDLGGHLQVSVMGLNKGGLWH